MSTEEKANAGSVKVKYTLKEVSKTIKEFKKKNPEIMKKVVSESYNHTSSINTRAFIHGFVRGWNERCKQE
jgi:hypothetical protein